MNNEIDPSGLNLNNPNADSRHHAPLIIKTQKGLTTEEHKRLVEGAIKQMGYKQEQIPDIERLIQEAVRRIEEVDLSVATLDKQIRDLGENHDKTQLMIWIRNRILDRFVGYNREEALLLLTTFLTERIIKKYI